MKIRILLLMIYMENSTG